MNDTTTDRPFVTFPRVLLIAAAGTSAAVAIASSRSGSDVRSAPSTDRWSGTIQDGAQVRIDNVNGAVRVARSPDATVRIVTTRRARGRRPEPLQLHVERRGADVVGCVVADGTECGSRTRRTGGLVRRLFRRYSPTEVTVVVALPADARLRVTTVNGAITVADAARDVELSTVNGSIVVGSTDGAVRASTVNGGITARLDGTSRGAPLSLETVNGSVTALLPAGTNGALTASTVNGHIENDFAPVVRDTRSQRIALGVGGSPIALTTVNGSVRVARVP